MAKAPANLIAYAQALLGWPIEVGSRVLTTLPNMGADNDSVMRIVPAGAMAKVDHIEWFTNDQRLAITLIIDVPERDADGDPNSISALFDEADGDDCLFPFKPVPKPAEKQTYHVNVRGIATTTIEVEAESKEKALQEASRILDEEVIEWSVDSEEVEGLA
jgi:hypothetical protein